MHARHHQLILNDWVSEIDVRINSFGVRTSQAKRVDYNNTELFQLEALIKYKVRKIYDGTSSIRASDLFYQSILLAHRWD